jgi:hypothetical protein
MKRTIIMTGIAVIAAAGFFAYPKAAEAYRGDPSVKGPNYSEERHQAMEKAFETKDFDAWKKLMQGRGRVTQVITKDNFAKFAEAHELAEEGKLQEAAKIRQELGLGLKNGSGRGIGLGRGIR